MAEVQNNNGDKKKGRQKKMNVFVDFTPMVDMNMLLITFFMLCTSLSKPQTMEISMPSNDKVSEEQQSKVKASKAMTFILGADDKVYYYLGEPDYKDYTSLKETDYTPDGMRALLLVRNRDVVAKMNDLKKQKAELKISEEEYTRKASYKNLVDALDEMQICNIGKYVIVNVTDGDEFLLKNYETSGELSRNIAGQV